MRSFASILATLLVAATAAQPAGALEFFVPSPPTPTLQMAIALASASPDKDNTIWITSSPLMTGAKVSIGTMFTPSRRLTIRPGETLERATVASNNGDVPIVEMEGCSDVTLQDLDIVRSATNRQHMVFIHYKDGFFPTNITIERCRIGSVWNSTGVADMAYLYVLQPVEVVVRNCIFFAAVPGTVDRGIWARQFDHPQCSLFLYNNVVADHAQAGIRVDPNGFAEAAGSLVVLRNNVVSNHPIFASEPYAYVGFVAAPMEVASSHNTGFATAGFREFVGAGALSISGFATGTFLTFARPAADGAFDDVSWNMIPAWDPNPNFWRLVDGGPLHPLPADASIYGRTVTGGWPHPRDYAVTDDIEHDFRPGGLASSLHTDRGADQIESGILLAVDGPSQFHGGLRASPLRNPAREVAVRFVAEVGGKLRFELYDLAGRLLHREDREVAAEESGTLGRRCGSGGGVVFYQVRFQPTSGGSEVQSGRLVMLE